jgi:hypothetical protein
MHIVSSERAFLGEDRGEKECISSRFGSVWENRIHYIDNVSSRTYRWHYTDL